MAFVLVWAGVMIKEKVEDRKERKRMKQVDIDRKYKELQEETQRRLSRTASGGLVVFDDADGERTEMEWAEEYVRREDEKRRQQEEKTAKRRHLSKILG
ncbi:hypothetical protein TI39_contig4301g00001 [Zymoseptoria brevis]|uniref:Uncharacterized protein n=1 Tax=Zymoseptoria brevis TaxID=1047168 RepID=A0A0F4G864_9PEZI|nr:hypothetical protein TI39_contig4301g00001 [Zymoseptoria brevis]